MKNLSLSLSLHEALACCIQNHMYAMQPLAPTFHSYPIISSERTKYDIFYTIISRCFREMKQRKIHKYEKAIEKEEIVSSLNVTAGPTPSLGIIN